MTNEKVLFAFRAEENEDGYTFIVNHDKEAFPFRCPFIAGHSYPSFKADMVKQLRKFRRSSKRRMRRRLKIYERMYRDLYGTQKEDLE